MRARVVLLTAVAWALLVVVLAGGEPGAWAASPQTTEPAAPPAGAAPPRPKLALVLSGGGARGAAHIGVLKVLEELRVKPDLIVGTSMGSIVGGLYAAGYSASDIERIFQETHWRGLFVDRIERRERSYRRKQDDATFLIPLRLRFKGWKPYLPPSALGGQRIDLMLRSLEIEATTVTDFDDLPIPFRAVAADLENAEAVVIGSGSLATAMRASMSIAGMFPPVEIDGRKLVDGGAAANLPVGIAQSMGAEQVIAVDITTPLGSLDTLGSVFQIYSQFTGYITEANRQADLKRIGPDDILITPPLGDISFMGFDRIDEAIKIGEEAARAAIPDLSRCSLDEAGWAACRLAHHVRPREETIVEAVRIENGSWVDDDIIAAHVELPTGEPYDAGRVNDQVLRLTGLDYSGTISAPLQQVDGRNTLTLQLPPKPYGRNSLQFGASFADDFEGTTSYTASIRHLLIAANRRGGEWENVAQLGSTSFLHTEFYQPFDAGMKWFAAAGGSTRRENAQIWSDGVPAVDYRVARQEAHLDFGRVFGRWGEARAGVFYAHEQGEVRVGLAFPEYDENYNGYRFSFSVDTLDATAFPRVGTSVLARWFASRTTGVADRDRDLGDVSLAHAFPLGKLTVYPNLRGCANYSDVLTFGSSCRLGGFLRLSGLGQDELLGYYSVFGSVIGYVALKKIDLGALSQELYAGLSYETGNAYLDAEDISWSSLIHSGSLFVGARTALGPIYLGYGLSEGGNGRIYFLLGQRF